MSGQGGTAGLDLASAIVAASLDAMVVMAADGRIVEWNAAAELTFGVSRDQALGTELAELVIPEDLRERHRRSLARYLSTGEAHILGRRLELRGLRADKTEFPAELTVICLPSSPPLFAGFVRDLSERREAEAETKAANDRLRLLAQAGAVFDRSLDPAETLAAIVELVVPELADLAVVDLLDKGGRIASGVAAHAVEPELARALIELRRHDPVRPGSSHPVAEVLRTGTGALLPAMDEAFLAEIAQSPEHLQFMRAVRYRSAVVAPMRARGRTLGALSVLRLRERVPYREPELRLTVELARRAATALDNARLYEDRAHTARILQAGLLPDALPSIPGVEVAAHYAPAAEGDLVGGDFYDLFALGPHRWGVVIGDVCGKGAEAAALTGLVRYTLRTVAPAARSPGEALEHVNEVILRERGDERFCTAAYAVLDLSAEPVVEVSCAGHPAPLRVEPAGASEAVCSPGMLLGVEAGIDLGDQTATLHPRESLLFYTDGLPEAGAPAHVLSSDELAGHLQRRPGLGPAEMARSLADLADDLGPGSRRDDLAVMVLQLDGA